MVITNDIRVWTRENNVGLWEAFDTAWKHTHSSNPPRNRIQLDLERFKEQGVQPRYVLLFLKSKRDEAGAGLHE
jgi:hypothetical protein